MPPTIANSTSRFPCWKCGEILTDVLLPLARLEECPQCRAQLHVCRMCQFFDPAAPQQCREPIADHVADKTRANFCGYFQLNPDAWSAPSGQAAESRSQLEAMFGGDESATAAEPDDPATKSREELDDLFKK